MHGTFPTWQFWWATCSKIYITYVFLKSATWLYSVFKHNYFEREVDLEHEGRCDFLKKPFSFTEVCAFSLCNGNLKGICNLQAMEKEGKVLGDLH